MKFVDLDQHWPVSFSVSLLLSRRLRALGGFGVEIRLPAYEAGVCMSLCSSISI
jgi:hypothetical protein